MKIAWCVLLACLMVGGCKKNDPPGGDNKDESEAEKAANAQLEGTWVPVDLKHRNRKKEGDQDDGFFVVFEIKAGKMTISSGEKERHRRSKTAYSFRLDPSQTPATIDLVEEEFWETEDERKPTEIHTTPNKKHLGIYDMDPKAKVLKLCWNSQKRPPEFSDWHPGVSRKKDKKGDEEQMGAPNSYFVLKKSSADLGEKGVKKEQE